MMQRERGKWLDYWADGDWWDAVFDPFFEIIGEGVWALLVAFAVGYALYAWTGTLIIPSVLLALLGGIVITALPPQAAIIGAILVATAMAMALMEIFGRDV